MIDKSLKKIVFFGVLLAVLFYLVCPKYTFYFRINEKEFGAKPQVWRMNNITGKVEFTNDPLVKWTLWAN